MCRPEADSTAKETEVTEVTSVRSVVTEPKLRSKETNISNNSTAPLTTVLKYESVFCGVREP